MKWTHTVLIDAPAGLVWHLTTEVEDWPGLAPTMQSVERLDAGPLAVGSSARIKQPLQRTVVWTVTDLEPGRSFRWHCVRRGLTVAGTHTVTSEAVGSSRNTLQVEALGKLAGPFGLLMGPAIRRALRVENAGFKRRAEHLAADAGTAA